MPPSRNADLWERRVVLVLLWAAAVAIVAVLVGRFWIPLDDGTLAQCAERVLHGQLPQRDFGDPYTGLNAFLGALSFRLFGVRLFSLRIPLVAGFALWLPAVWLLCRRFAGAGVALAGTVLAAALSVLAYPAAMPTWFVLFLVTWGAWAFVRFQGEAPAAAGQGPAAPRDAGPADEASRRAHPGRAWLFLAGAAAGVGILFKVVGLYVVAALLLSLARRRSGGRAMAWLVSAGVAAFLLVLGRLLVPTGGLAATTQFFMPVAALALAVLVGAWRRRTEAVSGGVRALLLDVTVIAVGVLVPVAVYLLPYMVDGGLRAWIEGVFVLPTRRLASAASAPSPLWTMLPGLAAVGLLWASGRLPERAREKTALALAALLAIGLAADDATDGAVFTALWYSARTWLPALALWGAWRFARDRSEHADAFALVATAVLWSLVQFPYPAPAYFFYVAPLAVPATLAVMRASGHRPGPVLGVIAGLYLYLGAGYAAGVLAAGTTPLPGDRAGIRVPEREARLYGALVDTVRAHGENGGLWAGPDAPEIYFLTGLPNPTPTIYEFLDATPPDSAEVASMLEANDVEVVVLNMRPLFSPPTPAPILRLLRDRYPRADTLGPFVVRWSPDS